jgi:hypothetical protein
MDELPGTVLSFLIFSVLRVNLNNRTDKYSGSPPHASNQSRRTSLAEILIQLPTKIRCNSHLPIPFDSFFILLILPIAIFLCTVRSKSLLIQKLTVIRDIPQGRLNLENHCYTVHVGMSS